MNDNQSAPALSPATIDLLRDLIFDTAQSGPVDPPTLRHLVFYSGGAVSLDEAVRIEQAIADGGDAIHDFLNVWHEVERLRGLTVAEIRIAAALNDRQAAIAGHWLEVLETSGESTSATRVLLTSLFALRLIERRSSTRPAHRSGSNLAVIGRSPKGLPVLVERNDQIRVRWSSPMEVQGETVYFSVHAGDSLLPIGSSRFENGESTLAIAPSEMAGLTLALSFDPPPPTSPFVLVFTLGSDAMPRESFARLAGVPLVVGGRLVLSVEWLPPSKGLGAGQLSFFRGTDPGNWQLLATQDFTSGIEDIEFSLDAAVPDGAFTWPLRLHWQESQ